MTSLEKLEALHPDVINSFLKKGSSDAIDEELQLFIHQLQMAAEVKYYYNSITLASKKLAERVWAEQRIKMSVRLAKERIYDAMNYFHVDNNVAQKIWDMNTADRLDNIALMLIKDDKFDQAAKWTVKANELRKRANEAVNNEEFEAPVFLFSPELSHEDMGFEKENLKKIAKEDADGYYLKLINNLDAEPEDKKRLLKDAGITDVEFEEIENE